MLPVTELLEIARDDTFKTDSRNSTPRYSAASRRFVPVVIWNVTGQCNMTCPQCYASAALKPQPGELSEERALSLLAELAAAGVSVVIFSGGEPLLRPDLFTLIGRATELGLHAQLSTNGVLIDDMIAQDLRSVGVHYVGISIDGLAAFNDPYRGLDGGYARASKGLESAKSAGLRTGLRVTLTRKNLDQLWALMDHAETLAVDRFYVSHLLYSGRAIRLNRDDLTTEECRDTLHALFERADQSLSNGASMQLVTGGNDSDGPALLEWVRTRYDAAAGDRVEAMLGLRGGNSAGEKIVNIDHRGEVHPDQFWRAASFGNVAQADFASVLDHPLRLQLLEREQHLQGRCQTCRFRPLCRGSHRERALSVHRNAWSPDPACVMTDAEIAGPEAPANMRSA